MYLNWNLGIFNFIILFSGDSDDSNSIDGSPFTPNFQDSNRVGITFALDIRIQYTKNVELF